MGAVACGWTQKGPHVEGVEAELSKLSTAGSEPLHRPTVRERRRLRLALVCIARSFEITSTMNRVSATHSAPQ